MEPPLKNWVTRLLIKRKKYCNFSKLGNLKITVLVNCSIYPLSFQFNINRVMAQLIKNLNINLKLQSLELKSSKLFLFSGCFF